MVMLKNETTESEQLPVLPLTDQHREVEIPSAAPVRLQTLDIARHVAIAPNGKRYVVATFDDTHLDRGYVTAIYPQQNGYLTLIRLVICELRSETPGEAVQKHISTVQVIQQGKLDALLRSLHQE